MHSPPLSCLCRRDLAVVPRQNVHDHHQLRSLPSSLPAAPPHRLRRALLPSVHAQLAVILCCCVPPVAPPRDLATYTSDPSHLAVHPKYCYDTTLPQQREEGCHHHHCDAQH